LPIEAVRFPARQYAAGVIGPRDLIAAVDRHGDALEEAIARKAVGNLEEFARSVRRLEVLHHWITTRIAQDIWLQRFPSIEQPDPQPLTCQLAGRVVPVSRLLEALRDVTLPERMLRIGASGPPAHDGRRGASASMVALSNAGVTTRDLAFELGVAPARMWRILNGRGDPPPGLDAALQRLAGRRQAQVILDAIPSRPRARRRLGPAAKSLRDDLGVSVDDVARLIPAAPATVARWLGGSARPSPKLIPALEQLVGSEQTERVLQLIPQR